MKKFILFYSLTCIYAASAHAAGESAHGKESSGLPQLDPTYFTSQAFWLVVVFGLMYLVFASKSIPAISQTVESRNDRIKNDLSSAEQIKKEVETVQASYEADLKDAREKSAKLFSDIELKIKEDSEKHAAEFAERSAHKIQELEKSIEKQHKKAMDEMTSMAAEIASAAAEKIIGVRADEKSIEKLVASINKAA